MYHTTRVISRAVNMAAGKRKCQVHIYDGIRNGKTKFEIPCQLIEENQEWHYSQKVLFWIYHDLFRHTHK